MIKNEENDWTIIEASNPINNKMVDGCFQVLAINECSY